MRIKKWIEIGLEKWIDSQNLWKGQRMALSFILVHSETLSKPIPLTNRSGS
jgi:hypothetical protein